MAGFEARSDVSSVGDAVRAGARKVTSIIFLHYMTWRTLYAVIAVLAGIFFIVFGGYDDSPGAQGIGLLLTIYGIVRLVMGKKSGTDNR